MADSTEYWRPKSIRIHKKDSSTQTIPVSNALPNFKGLGAGKDNNIDLYIKWIKANTSLEVSYTGAQDGNVIFNEL